SQRAEQYRTDIRVRAEPHHHVVGVLVAVAAGEADDVDIVVLEGPGDALGRMPRALHEIGNDDGVANALPPVAPQPSAHRHRSPPGCRTECSAAWRNCETNPRTH